MVADCLGIFWDVNILLLSEIPDLHTSDRCLWRWTYFRGTRNFNIGKNYFTVIVDVYCFKVTTVTENIIIDFFKRIGKRYFFKFSATKCVKSYCLDSSWKIYALETIAILECIFFNFLQHTVLSERYVSQLSAVGECITSYHP